MRSCRLGKVYGSKPCTATRSAMLAIIIAASLSAFPSRGLLSSAPL